MEEKKEDQEEEEEEGEMPFATLYIVTMITIFVAIMAFILSSYGTKAHGPYATSAASPVTNQMAPALCVFLLPLVIGLQI